MEEDSCRDNVYLWILRKNTLYSDGGLNFGPLEYEAGSFTHSIVTF